MLLYDSICIGYGYVLLVWIRCHLIVLSCISLFTSACCVELVGALLVQQVQQCRTLSAAMPHLAAAASICVHDLSYASRLFMFDTMCSTPQEVWM
jgi:hypothetical protein